MLSTFAILYFQASNTSETFWVFTPWIWIYWPQSLWINSCKYFVSSLRVFCYGHYRSVVFIATTTFCSEQSGEVTVCVFFMLIRFEIGSILDLLGYLYLSYLKFIGVFTHTYISIPCSSKIYLYYIWGFLFLNHIFIWFKNIFNSKG